MKNRSVLKRALWCAVVVLVVGALGALAGCGRPGDGGAPAESPSGGDPAHPSRETGMIYLSIPPEIFSGAGNLGALAVDTPSAQADAEVVEVLVLEELPGGDAGALEVGDAPTLTTSVTVSAPSEEPVEMAVPPGTYRVLVLVGSASGDTSCLLASGYTDTAVEVVEDQHTEVTIDLTTISHSVTVPDSVVAGSPYEISAMGDTNSPVLTTDSEGSTNTYRFQAKFDTESSAKAVQDVSFVGSQWNLTYPAEAPASENDANWYSAWQLAGPYLTYKDANTGAWIALDGDISRKWRWLSYTVLSTSSQLWPEVSVPVVIETSTTGMAIDITWS
ncbi:MAG: hypothetical protein WD492_10295 [Alkalispirochaeta sp.]